MGDRNHGRVIGAAALAAAVALGGCSSLGGRTIKSAKGYKIGVTSARLSAQAQTGELPRRKSSADTPARASAPRARAAARPNRETVGAKAVPTKTAAVRTHTTPGSVKTASVSVAAPPAAPPAAAGQTAAASAAAPPSSPPQTTISLQRATFAASAAESAAPRSAMPSLPPMASLPSMPSRWSWLAAIGAGFIAALALAWVLRPRRAHPVEAAPYATPTPANDREPTKRGPRRPGPPPPRVTILAGSGGR